MTTTPACPVLQDTQHIQGLSHDLTKALRKLRRDLTRCEQCPSYDDCPILKEFNSQVQAALDEVSAEWDYSSVK